MLYYLSELDSFHGCENYILGKEFDSKGEGMRWISDAKKALKDTCCFNPSYIAYRTASSVDELPRYTNFKEADVKYYTRKVNYYYRLML